MFSIFTLICTLISLGIVLGLETEISAHTYGYVEREMHFHIDEADFHYKYIDWHRFPIVASVFMAIYEGSTVVVTIYSEAAEPQNFLRNVIFGYAFVGVFGILFGYYSYITLGSKINDIILLVLPNGSHWAIFCKSMYLVTIMGSYVIMLQPIFNIAENFKAYKECTVLSDNAKYYSERLLVVALSIIGGLLLPNVNIVLQLTGSLGGTLIGVIIPYMLYHQAYAVSGTKSDWKRNLMSNITLVVGCGIGIIGLMDTVNSLIK